jgi:DNA polymerase alpha subunit B
MRTRRGIRCRPREFIHRLYHHLFTQNPLLCSEYSQRVQLLPNPCRFSINDVSFAVTTVDVLFHLRKEEYFKSGEEVESEQPFLNDPGDDVMANLCRHLLQQRRCEFELRVEFGTDRLRLCESFYPIFPVPVDMSHEVNLDVSHAEGLNLSCEIDDEYAPDIFILPSRLKSFTKVWFR